MRVLAPLTEQQVGGCGAERLLRLCPALPDYCTHKTDCALLPQVSDFEEMIRRAAFKVYKLEAALQSANDHLQGTTQRRKPASASSKSRPVLQPASQPPQPTASRMQVLGVKGAAKSAPHEPTSVTTAR